MSFDDFRGIVGVILMAAAVAWFVWECYIKDEKDDKDK